jgi:hypothetical protein
VHADRFEQRQAAPASAQGNQPNVRKNLFRPRQYNRIAQWSHSLPEHDDWNAASNRCLDRTQNGKVPFLAAVSESPRTAYDQQISVMKRIQEEIKIVALAIPAPEGQSSMNQEFEDRWPSPSNRAFQGAQSNGSPLW